MDLLIELCNEFEWNVDGIIFQIFTIISCIEFFPTSYLKNKETNDPFWIYEKSSIA